MDKLKAPEVGTAAAFRTKSDALGIRRAFLKKFRLDLAAAIGFASSFLLPFLEGGRMLHGPFDQFEAVVVEEDKPRLDAITWDASNQDGVPGFPLLIQADDFEDRGGLVAASDSVADAEALTFPRKLPSNRRTFH